MERSLNAYKESEAKMERSLNAYKESEAKMERSLNAYKESEAKMERSLNAYKESEAKKRKLSSVDKTINGVFNMNEESDLVRPIEEESIITSTTLPNTNLPMYCYGICDNDVWQPQSISVSHPREYLACDNALKNGKLLEKKTDITKSLLPNYPESNSVNSKATTVKTQMLTSPANLPDQQHFKIPMLKPATRPPGRCSASNKSSPSLNAQDKISSILKKDAAVSFQTRPSLCNRTSPSLNPQGNVSSVVKSDAAVSFQQRSSVNNKSWNPPDWITSVVKSDAAVSFRTRPSVSSGSSPSLNPQGNVSSVVKHNPAVSFQTGPSVSSRSFPSLNPQDNVSPLVKSDTAVSFQQRSSVNNKSFPSWNPRDLITSVVKSDVAASFRKRPFVSISLSPSWNPQDNVSSLWKSDAAMSLQQSSIPCRSNENLLENNERWMTDDRFKILTHNRENIPWTFKSLCYFYYTNTCSSKGYFCTRQHCVTRDIINKIKGLEHNQLINAYTYAKERHKLYKETVLDFLDRFKMVSDDSQLIRCVGDILNITYNKTPLIEKVIFHLSRLGTSFSDAIDQIITVNDSKNTCLSDILLDIICRRKEDISENWCLVKKLLQGRVEPVDHGLVEEVVIMCYETENINLAKCIINDIIKLVPINLEMFNSNTLRHFISLLHNHHLQEEKQALLSKINTCKNNQGSAFSRSIEHTDENNQPSVSSDVLSNSRFNSEAMCSNSQINVPQDCTVSSNIDTSISFVRGATNYENSATITKTSLEKFKLLQNYKNLNSVMETDYSNSLQLDLNFNSGRNLNPSYSTIHLHNFAPPDRGMLSETELINLRNSIQEGKNIQFVLLLSNFKDGSIYLQRQFVLDALVCFKNKTPDEVYSMVFKVLTGLEHMKSDYLEDAGVKNMVTMLTINVIGMLESNSLYKEATYILLKFRNNLESLRDATWLMEYHRHVYSESGKFLYFCKIFVKGTDVKEAWRILTRPDLNFLYGITRWTVQYNKLFDNSFRNSILGDLITVSLSIDLPFAKYVILHILENNDIITEIDIWDHFNQLLLKLLDSGETYIEYLTTMLPNVLEGWYKNLNQQVMRGLLVRLMPEISLSDAVDLYSKCCKQHCYPYIKGNEKTLTLDFDMLEQEIQMTLHVYFYKKMRNNFPLCDLVLFINLPETMVHQPKILLNCNDAIDDMKTKICNVLTRSLPHHITAMVEKSYIFIKVKDMEMCYSHYKHLS